ncbi:Hypothetical protein NTJ_01590 [Nesidiocoris tenuis]|uniref:Uncharacterized protein n=1 Tax=Nesidiocoris tenuis TaxID=355587 RepID=A0ABN7A8Z5_9HEMI|nr:Hypothetical protein NTJ_01590 [Nesidiocoris tenuis]
MRGISSFLLENWKVLQTGRSDPTRSWPNIRYGNRFKGELHVNDSRPMTIRSKNRHQRQSNQIDEWNRAVKLTGPKRCKEVPEPKQNERLLTTWIVEAQTAATLRLFRRRVHYDRRISLVTRTHGR